MATIQVRNIAEEDADLLRAEAEAQGMSLQAYMQREVTALARRRAKASALTAYRNELAHSDSGVTGDFIADALRELRGE